MAGKEQGPNLREHFFQKLLQTKAVLESNAQRYPSPKLLSWGSVWAPQKTGGKFGALLSDPVTWQTNNSGFVSKPFAASKICICNVTLPVLPSVPQSSTNIHGLDRAPD